MDNLKIHLRQEHGWARVSAISGWHGSCLHRVELINQHRNTLWWRWCGQHRMRSTSLTCRLCLLNACVCDGHVAMPDADRRMPWLGDGHTETKKRSRRVQSSKALAGQLIYCRTQTDKTFGKQSVPSPRNSRQDSLSVALNFIGI